MIRPSVRRAILHGATALIVAAAMAAGARGWRRERDLDLGAISTTFPPEMDEFRRRVLRVLPPSSGFVLVDSADEAWERVFIERAFYPRPVRIVLAPTSRLDAELARLRREHVRFVLVGGRPPEARALRRPQPLPPLSGFSTRFLFGRLGP